MFTLRLEPQVIHIKDAGREVVEENCERCHEHLLGYYHSIGSGRENEENEENEVMCWSCHKEVPHGKVSSLSSFPNARVPKLSPVLPEWLIKALNNK
jgi:cytochrome c nitrite reductase small subunit